MLSSVPISPFIEGSRRGLDEEGSGSLILSAGSSWWVIWLGVPTVLDKEMFI